MFVAGKVPGSCVLQSPRKTYMIIYCMYVYVYIYIYLLSCVQFARCSGPKRHHMPGHAFITSGLSCQARFCLWSVCKALRFTETGRSQFGVGMRRDLLSSKVTPICKHTCSVCTILYIIHMHAQKCEKRNAKMPMTYLWNDWLSMQRMVHHMLDTFQGSCFAVHVTTSCEQHQVK